MEEATPKANIFVTTTGCKDILTAEHFKVSYELGFDARHAKNNSEFWIISIPLVWLLE